MSNIVYEGTSKSGRKFIVRYPEISDSDDLLNYINTISLEKTYITFQGEQLTLDEEIKYIQKTIDLRTEHKAATLIVVCDDKIIGSAEIDLGRRNESHVGTLGITVAKDFRGDGIGKQYMQALIDEAIKTLPALRVIKLIVFANNLIARELYKKLGFIECGTLPEGLLYKGEYIDQIEMFQKIK